MVSKLLTLITTIYFGVVIYNYFEHSKLDKKFNISNKSIEANKLDLYQIKDINNDLHYLLEQIASQRFFKIYNVISDKECKFWHEEHKCNNRACVVESLTDKEIPEKWKQNDLLVDGKYLNKKLTHRESIWNQETLEDIKNHATYIDLDKNPESFTGYQGKNIWPIIYNENCFDTSKNGQSEYKLMNHLISGMHTSLNSHICENFMDMKTNLKFPNLKFYFERVASFPERIKNLFFSYSFLVRALSKLSSNFDKLDLSVGNEQLDKELLLQLKQLKESINKFGLSDNFLENEYFNNPVTQHQLKATVSQRLKNITDVVDCVVCLKCKIHSKMQIHGIATAFRILFTNETNEELLNSLTRNDLVSLVNTISKFSKSIYIIDKMYERRQQKFFDLVYFITAVYLVVVFTVFMGQKFYRFMKERKQKRKRVQKTPEQKSQ